MKTKEQRLKERRDMLKSATMIFELSLSAICPIILLLCVGIWLDGKYGNGGYWFTAAGIICGIYSAYRGTYYMIKGIWLKEDDNVGSDSKNDE